MSAWLRPSEIRFTQDTIGYRFRNKKFVNSTAEDLSNGKLGPEDFPKIRVVRIDEDLYSLDNRRLYVFRVAEYRGKLDKIEVTRTSLIGRRKLTTINKGREVKFRQGITTYAHCKSEWLRPSPARITIEPISFDAETTSESDTSPQTNSQPIDTLTEGITLALVYENKASVSEVLPQPTTSPMHTLPEDIEPMSIDTVTEHKMPPQFSSAPLTEEVNFISVKKEAPDETEVHPQSSPSISHLLHTPTEYNQVHPESIK